tara:strand:- start:711 stop:938 length:228 start_codon:yes stop_codon:yes gene_type:complete
VLRIEIEREDDGRWLAEFESLPDVMAYGSSREEARSKVEALALRVLADRMGDQAAVPFSSRTPARRLAGCCVCFS